MNREELAEQLNNAEYPFEPDSKLMETARENKLVVVFGSSDDLMEFRGFIDDEFYCYDGGTAHVSNDGLVQYTDCEECMERRIENSIPVKAVWCGLRGYSWNYEIDIPHTTFEILEDGENYCRGIVFSINDLK